MRNLRIAFAVLMFCWFSSVAPKSASAENVLPDFGRDTVLVWKIVNQDYNADFVVRIAEFAPDRFLEWEDAKTQGTIFMPNRDVVSAKGYSSANLFESGMDSRGKDATTLWLSQRIYRELKEKKKAKCILDGVSGTLLYKGEGQITLEVNRSSATVPVIIIADDRGGERWFLDRENNPLMLKHAVRNYVQVLASITTDRPNTLRWIKGKKLHNLPLK
jgi:hypothetical protein